MRKLVVLDDLADRNELLERLLRAKVSPAEAPAKVDMICRCREALLAAGRQGKDRFYGFYVPGRIEVLGKHTDYAGGRSLLVATGKGFIFVASPRPDSTVRLIPAGNTDLAETFEIDPELAPKAGHWTNYPMTVARRVARNFPGQLKGVDIAFDSDLPPAAGMSSSSALVVASFLAYAAVNDLASRPEYRQNISSLEDLAEYLGCNENGQTFRTLVGDKGVGTFGGSEDHTAILCGKSQALSEYSFCPVKFERHLPMPPNTLFVVASSGILAEKTGPAKDKYNRASLLAGAVARIWREATGRSDANMAAAVRSSPDAPKLIRDVLAKSNDEQFKPAELMDRFEQFYGESFEVIPAAADALARGDVTEFGRQVDRSQELTHKQLGNLVPETVFLPACAREIGALAASAFGAGFGGSVWAMVSEEQAEGFAAQWAQRYAVAFPGAAAKAGFFLTHAGPAAFEI